MNLIGTSVRSFWMIGVWSGKSTAVPSTVTLMADSVMFAAETGIVAVSSIAAERMGMRVLLSVFILKNSFRFFIYYITDNLKCPEIIGKLSSQPYFAVWLPETVTDLTRAGIVFPKMLA